MSDAKQWSGQDWSLVNGDCVEGLAQMPDASVDVSVFSVPFSNLYIYSDSERDMGNCADHEEFLAQHAFFARELYRVMKPGAVVCDHVKDLVFYQNSSETGEGGLYPFSDEVLRNYRKAGFVLRARVTVWRDPVREMQKTKHERLLYKNIRGNSRVSAMGMPEYILVLRKDSRGIKVGEPVDHFAPGDTAAADAIVARHLPIDASPEALQQLLDEKRFSLEQWQEWASPVWMNTRQTDVLNGRFKGDGDDERHICPMPLDLIERCLTLYSNRGDVVLDPFAGIGSTGVVALRMKRKFLGFELKPEYAREAVAWLKAGAQGAADLFDEVAA